MIRTSVSSNGPRLTRVLNGAGARLIILVRSRGLRENDTGAPVGRFC